MRLLPLFPLRLLLPVLVFAVLPLRAATVVHLGAVKQFTGPADANLDLAGVFDYAINFSPNDPVRTVSGLAFRPDTQAITGAVLTGPQNVAPWQAKPEFGSSADANALEEIMQDIRWANSGSGEKLQARLAVSPGIRYKIQILISGNGAENRRWDIRLNGQQAVDEITSLGASPGNSYSSGRSTVWSHEFIAAGATVNVEMGDFFGANDGGDRNPIWQALTLERIHIPPAPEGITLSSASFFPSQTAAVGDFTVTDGKFGAAHVLTFVSGSGSEDNAKFTLDGGRLLPAPFDFTAQPPGVNYSIRVRATDAEDAARGLEKPFTLSLAAPRAPAAVTLNATSLSSGLITGQTAALLSASDPDVFDRHVFSFAAGPGDGQNALFTISGNELKTAAAPPAGLASVSLRLRAVDLSGLAVETVIELPLVEPRVRINEVLGVSTRDSQPKDQDSRRQDWIELYNELAQPVNLTGWRLTDDPAVPDKWTFPDVTIAPHGYLLVFASGDASPRPSGPPHTNFSLSQEGEQLILSRPDGVVLSDVTPAAMYPNVTWGAGAGVAESGHLLTPTPGAENSRLAAAGSNDVLFSMAHGFKTAAFPLTLTATVPGSVIRYTLDGSVPKATSPVYSGPIMITPVAGTVRSGTRIVRAVAIHPDAAWAPVATQSYFFVNGVNGPAADGVVGQSNFFNSIRNHAVYKPLLGEALLSLPAVSLVINNTTGLPLAETESSLELFDPHGGEPGFTISAGVVRSGTSSLNFAKGSMSARFRGEYGATRLNYPVYGRHPHDAQGAVTEFQELRLRSCSHDSLSWLGTADNPSVPYGSPPVTRSGDAQFMRNNWIEDTQLLMGQPGKHGRLVNMFVNGNYYGIYHIQEHADDDYMGSYYPGGSDDYHFTGGGTTGSEHNGESWREVWAKLKASLNSYTEAKRWVDVTNLADYMILTFYAGNDWDWSTLHNWGAAGPRLPDRGGWKFFSQDQDVSLQDVNADNTDQTAPDNVFHRLMAHEDFKVLFRDRVYRHLFHDGVLTPAKAAGYYKLRADEIFSAIVAETARWQPTSSVGPLPWDRDGEWTVENKYLMNTFFPQRTAKLLTQLRARGWYPVNAPEMSLRGGIVEPGTQVLLTAPAGAAIYYTLDGSDPRLPGGAVSPSALSYTAAQGSITLNAAATLKTRARSGTQWSGLNEAGFQLAGTPPAVTGNIVISEIHYHPEGEGQGDAEFVEFLNTSTQPADMAGVRLGGGVTFTFPQGMVLSPGERVVVVKNAQLFDARYRDPGSPWYHAGIRVAGVWAGSLSNGGETLTVTAAAEEAPIFSTSWEDGGEWPGRADGGGSSLELADPAAAPMTLPEKEAWLHLPGNWRSSAEFHGTPGYAGAGPDSRIVINEILPAPLSPDISFIELYNRSAENHTIGGWFLSDTTENLRKYRLPAGSTLAPGAWLALTAQQFNNAADAGCLTPFNLNETGGDVYLVEADAAGNLLRFVDRVLFSATPGGMALGRASGGAGALALLRQPSAGAANAAPIPEYGVWAASGFPPNTPPADMAPGADPDRDGLPNLLEFGLGLRALVPDPAPVIIRSGLNGQPEIQFNARHDVPGLSVKIQVSTGLSVWDDSETHVERISEQIQPGGMTTVIARFRQPQTETRRYFRISVSF